MRAGCMGNVEVLKGTTKGGAAPCLGGGGMAAPIFCLTGGRSKRKISPYVASTSPETTNVRLRPAESIQSCRG